MNKVSLAKVLLTGCLFVSLIALYASYTSLANARASSKAVDAIITAQSPHTTTHKSKVDIPGWNCNNTVRNEPGKPVQLIGQTCTAGIRVELEPPVEDFWWLSRFKQWLDGE